MLLSSILYYNNNYYTCSPGSIAGRLILISKNYAYQHTKDIF